MIIRKRIKKKPRAKIKTKVIGKNIIVNFFISYLQRFDAAIIVL